MKIEEVSIAKVIPYENNPRINDAGVDATAASIEHFGFRNPIIVDKNMVIVAGHTRFKDAQKLGLKKVPVIRAEDMTEDQVKKFRIFDNKTQEIADWDLEVMREELAGISGIDMSEFGFLMKDIEDQKQKEAKAEGAKKKIQVKEICCPRCGRVVSVE